MTYKNILEVIDVDKDYYNFIQDTELIFNSAIFYNEVENQYFDLSIFYHKENATIVEVSDYFKRCFDTWKSQNGYNVSRFFKGLKEEYNPIENYDRYESGKITDEMHKGTKTANAFESVTTPTEIIKNSNYVVGDDNATPLLDSYSEAETLSGNTTTSGDVTKNYTLTQDIDADTFDKNVKTFEGYRIHGNIGVLTSSDALLKEYELRKQNFVSEIIKDFIVKYTMYIDC